MINEETGKEQHEKSDLLSKIISLGKGSCDEQLTKTVLESLRKNNQSTTQLKGFIHEELFKNQQNFSVKSVLNGEKAHLSANAFDPKVDVYITKNGKIIEELQLKDTISEGGINGLIRRIKNGQYDGVELVVTPETAQKLKEQGITNVRSSGISSTRTTYMADNAGEYMPNSYKNVLQGNIKEIGKSAKSAGLVSAIIGAGTEAYSKFGDYRKGDIDELEYAESVVKNGVTEGAASAGKTFTALGIKEGFKGLARLTGQQSLKKIAGSNAVTGVAFGLVDQGIHYYKYKSGKIDENQFNKNTSQNIGATGGSVAGTAAGAAIGTMFLPVIGTAVGAVAGGIVGSIFGGKAGEETYNRFFHHNKKQIEKDNILIKHVLGESLETRSYEQLKVQHNDIEDIEIFKLTEKKGFTDIGLGVKVNISLEILGLSGDVIVDKQEAEYVLGKGGQIKILEYALQTMQIGEKATFLLSSILMPEINPEGVELEPIILSLEIFSQTEFKDFVML